MNETSRRLAKPRNIAMTQSSINGLPLSRSSHQIRLTTPPVATTTSSNIRRVNKFEIKFLKNNI
jgi:hypothetical protein